MKYEDEVFGWRRQWAVRMAVRIGGRKGGVARVLEDARKLEAYVNGTPPAELVLINQQKGKTNDQ